MSDRYSFVADERDLVEHLRRSLWELLRRQDLEAGDFRGIADFIVALDRLPEVTEGFGAEVSFRIEHEDGSSGSWSVALDDVALRLETYEVIYSPGIGGDSSGQTVLRVGIGWREEPDYVGIVDDFLELFSSMASDTTHAVRYECIGDPDATLTASLPARDRWDRCGEGLDDDVAG